MTFSILIVSYNVKYFLEHCLFSVQKALENAEPEWGDWQQWAEIIVVDNASADQSLEYLAPKFSGVTFLSNAENLGFARANNQILQQASGKFVLFLNPDTILPEGFFIQASRFMQEHAGAGALGVRMLDASGRFLRESKRGFPGGWASFCKLSGLCSLFPRSRWFAGYYLGHLDPGQTHEVDALSGACMMCRRDVLEKTGGFDERFFMYAEDIDLSYRIQQCGWLNYYVPAITIIHFKGESTRKDYRYVRQFYRAMGQFVAKYGGKAYPGFSQWLFQLGIAAGAAFSMIKHALRPGKPQHFAKRGPFFLVGDPDGVNRLREILGNRVAAGPQTARATVYCEGAALSFSEIIGLLPDTRKLKFIHSRGSGSLVGGGNSQGPGDAVELEQNAGEQQTRHEK